MIKTIELEKYSNSMALKMGLTIVDLAKSHNQHSTIEISRLKQTVFYI